MKHLRIFESYFSNEIKIVLTEETMMYAYWDVYYVVNKDNKEYPTLSFKDYTESILDALSGDITDYLGISLPRYDKQLNNLNLDADNFTIKISTNYEVDDSVLERLDKFMKEESKEYMDNSKRSMDKIDYEIYYNGKLFRNLKGDKDYSSLGKKEVQKLIDDALDKRDFERVKILSKFMETKTLGKLEMPPIKWDSRNVKIGDVFKSKET